MEEEEMVMKDNIRIVHLAAEILAMPTDTNWIELEISEAWVLEMK